jgi:Holliday junction DNA helicase RuvA
MYASIRGKLLQNQTTYIVLEAQGIGFKIWIATNTLGKIPAPGEELLLHTSFVVREFSQALYGFIHPEERDLFETLIDISGIGPKTALSLIGHLSLQGLQDVVLTEDIKTLCKVPGIGKKTAERLLVELKNKLDGFFTSLPQNLFIPTDAAKNSHVQDAIKALVNLGYNTQAAHKAVKQALDETKTEPNVGQLITHALKRI